MNVFSPPPIYMKFPRIPGRLSGSLPVQAPQVATAIGSQKSPRLLALLTVAEKWAVEPRHARIPEQLHEGFRLQHTDQLGGLRPVTQIAPSPVGEQVDRDTVNKLKPLFDNTFPVVRRDAFAEADTDFHASLAASTGNKLLMWIIAQINSVRSQNEWTRMRNLTLEPTIIARYNAQYRQIVAAIRAREPEQAAIAMKERLETARLSLTRAAAT